MLFLDNRFAPYGIRGGEGENQWEGTDVKMTEYNDLGQPKQEPDEVVKVDISPLMTEYMKQRHAKITAEIDALDVLLSKFSAEQLVLAVMRAPSLEIAEPFVRKLIEKDLNAADTMLDYLKKKFKNKDTSI